VPSSARNSPVPSDAELDDRQCFDALGSGNRALQNAALHTLGTRYGRRFLGRLRTFRWIDEATADDIVQELFIDLVGKDREALAGVSHPEGWLWTKLTNKARDAVRRIAIREKHLVHADGLREEDETEDLFDQLASNWATPIEQLVRQQDRDCEDGAWTEYERRFPGSAHLLKFHVSGMKDLQLAEITGRTHQAIRQRLYLARKEFGEILRALCPKLNHDFGL
jgi:DNA-directed RNA polymerase specialized sigma24 family protein